MHSHDLCFFQLENHTSKVKSREFSVQKINYGVTYHKSMVRGGRQKNNGFSGAQSSGLSTSGQASNSYKFKTKYMR